MNLAALFAPGLSFKPPANNYTTQNSNPGSGSGCGCGGGCGSGSGSGNGATQGSTLNPVNQPAAPTGYSAGITSPQPANPAGFLGLGGGAAVGDGWPSGGFARPKSGTVQSSSTAQSGGRGAAGTPVQSSGQGYKPRHVHGPAVSSENGGALIALAIVGIILYNVL